MAMSKKDFTLVAEIVSQGMCQDGSHEDAFEQTAFVIIHDLAAAFAANYPNFDKEKFLKATGVL